MTVPTQPGRPDTPPRDMHISLREARLVVERLLVVTGVPLGTIPAVRDFVIDAECMGLGAFTQLRHDFDGIRKDSKLGGLGQTEVGTAVAVTDAGGRSGLLIGPDVADLAIGLASKKGISVLGVTGVRDPAFLEAICAPAPLLGVSLCVLTGLQAARLAVSGGSRAEVIDDAHLAPRPSGPPSGKEEDPRYGNCLVVCSSIRNPAGPERSAGGAEDRQLGPYLRGAVEAGFTLDEDLWWWLYHESGQALTPDSPLSRRHTGASVLDTYGNIMGEIGEDWEEERTG